MRRILSVKEYRCALQALSADELRQAAAAYVQAAEELMDRHGLHRALFHAPQIIIMPGVARRNPAVGAERLLVLGTAADARKDVLDIGVVRFAHKRRVETEARLAKIAAALRG